MYFSVITTASSAFLSKVMENNRLSLCSNFCSPRHEFVSWMFFFHAFFLVFFSARLLLSGLLCSLPSAEPKTQLFCISVGQSTKKANVVVSYDLIVSS